MVLTLSLNAKHEDYLATIDVELLINYYNMLLKLDIRPWQHLWSAAPWLHVWLTGHVLSCCQTKFKLVLH